MNWQKTAYKLSLIALILTFLVIIAGGVVRATGSGMGCPDWPTCFGKAIPPTSILELPLDYKTRFAVNGKTIADFSAFKTWTEFINRLFGVLMGLGVFALLISSFSFFRKSKTIPLFAFFIFLCTGFQGWLGSLVVASNLNGVKISLHMLFAALIVFLILILRQMMATHVFRGALFKETISKYYFYINLGALALTLTQVFIGTFIRKSVDEIATSFHEAKREQWIDYLPDIYLVHKSLSWLVLGATLYLFFKLVKVKSLTFESIILVGLVGLEVIAGLVLHFLKLPAWATPIHLTLSIGILAILFNLTIKTYNKSFRNNANY